MTWYIVTRVVEIAAVLGVFLALLAVGSGKLVRLWVVEPVGIGVPLIGALIVYLAPQMADMFAALRSTSRWHEAQLGLGVLVLGLQSWFWQRAALNARGGYRDADAPPDLSWQELYAARLTLLPVGLIACYPIYLALMNQTSGESIPWFGVSLSVFICLLLGWLAWRRRKLMVRRGRQVTRRSMPESRVVRLFVAAPGGPWIAVAALAIALAAVWALDSWSEIDASLHTPTVAFIALGSLVAANTVTLAMLRDGSEFFVRVVRRLARWPDRPTAVLLGDIIGFGFFVSLLSIGEGIAEKLGFYDVPVLAWERPANVPSRQTIKEAVADFRKCHGDLDEEARQRDRLAIIVALEGGASRSAAWSLSVMRMLDERTGGEFGRNLFAISSVSGGSLAAVTYSLLRADTEDVWTNATRGLVSLARGDLLASSAVRIFGTDPYIGLPLRGWSLTSAFERLWREKRGFYIGSKKAGLVASQQARRCVPHLFLNGTDVASGGRLITSTIAFEGEDYIAKAAPFSEAVDVLFRMGGDIAPGDAVMNSARFPVISPPGKLMLRYGSKQVPRRVVDGGVFEGYGLRTAWELANAMKSVDRSVVPLVVIISNDTELAANTVPLGSCRSQAGTVAINEITEAFETSGKVRKDGEEESVAEILTSPVGFLASRGSHALSEIAWTNRMMCDEPTRPRSFQFNLPRPDAKKNQAAPMNWVLSPFACSYILGEALLPNLFEADRLGDILAGRPVRLQQAAAPALSSQTQKLAERCLSD